MRLNADGDKWSEIEYGLDSCEETENEIVSLPYMLDIYRNEALPALEFMRQSKDADYFRGKWIESNGKHKKSKSKDKAVLKGIQVTNAIHKLKAHKTESSNTSQEKTQEISKYAHGAKFNPSNILDGKPTLRFDLDDYEYFNEVILCLY